MSSILHADPLESQGTIHADSWVARLDPRAKLASAVVLLICGFVSASIWFCVTLTLMLVAVVLAAGINPRLLWQSGKSILLLVAITFTFHLVFSTVSESPLIQPFGLAITKTALLRGAYFSSRLVLFVTIVLFLTLTTSATQLAEGVVKLARPLRKIGVPVDDVGLIMSLALRFIPILHEEFVAIRRAQTLRGLRFAGSFMHRIRMTVPLLVPVFVAAVDRADIIALAIETRGYRHHAERTYFSRSRLGAAEFTFVVAAIAVAVGVLLATRA
jgi:energy-coupling factor transport system permease protein